MTTSKTKQAPKPGRTATGEWFEYFRPDGELVLMFVPDNNKRAGQ